MIAEAEERSRSLLSAGLTPAGFVASPDFEHYATVWARDACVAALGALTTDDPGLVAGAAATLDTLAAAASPFGQIPAVVNPRAGVWDWGEGGAVDPSCWFPILAGHHLAATGDLERASRWWPAVEAALGWLAHQDVTGSGLISAAPSTDWMDAALTRSGRTLHLNALYAWAAAEAERMAGALEQPPPVDAAVLRRRVDVWFWPDPSVDVGDLYPHGFAHQALRVSYWEAGSYRRRHYASHVVHNAYVDACDVLANLVAVLAGVPSAERGAAVLDRLAGEADAPFPSRSLLEPVASGDGTGMLIAAVEANLPPRWRNRPGRYHNGAVWPYIGGFHAAASAARSSRDQAWSVLERVAAANALDDWSFPEWIDLDGAPNGARHQTWNAGAYLYGLAACRGAGSPGAGR